MTFALVSIWLALYLAKKQLRADFKKAADGAVERVAHALLGTDLGDAIRHLREADKAISERDWLRGIIRMEDVAASISRLTPNPKLSPHEQVRLKDAVIDIETLIVRIRRHARSKRAGEYLPANATSSLGSLGNELEQLRGRLIHN